MGTVCKRTVGRPVQGSLICEGMVPDAAPSEDQMGDVFALWVERIEDLNTAIAEHNARTSTGHHHLG